MGAGVGLSDSVSPSVERNQFPHRSILKRVLAELHKLSKAVHLCPSSWRVGPWVPVIVHPCSPCTIAREIGEHPHRVERGK